MKKRIITILLIVCAILCLSSCGYIDLYFDESSQQTAIENSDFEIVVLDVGQADSIYIQCDGEKMLIDGGNVGDSNLVYSFLEKRGADMLDYIVCTHGHEDHCGGLAGALNYATAGTVYSPVGTYDSEAFRDFRKYVEAQGNELKIPKVGDTFSLGSAEVLILGPVDEYEDTNNTSIVLKITYGSTSYIFTGDAEEKAEKDILKLGYDLSADVLKVGHHGSDTSTSYEWLNAILPQYALISVGTDNKYDHPSESTLSKLRDADVTVYRTDMQGDIFITSDGKNISITTEKGSSAITNPTVDTDKTQEKIEYVGNKSSKIFHTPNCSSLPDEENRVYFDDRQTATDEGYEPCGKCKP